MSNLTISYADFSNNFITHIRTIEKDHTDETGTYDYGVGFNVVCLLNSRVMYFEDHLNKNVLPDPYTDQDVVDAAWTAVKPDVKNWSSTAMSLPSLIGSTWTPPTDLSFNPIGNFTFDTFITNFTTTISSFEVYPQNEPSSWRVGFVITNNNNTTDYFYMGTNVFVNTFAVTKAEEEILELAWSGIKDQIAVTAKDRYDASALINTVFSAPSNDW
jgi:hypothetical protein